MSHSLISGGRNRARYKRLWAWLLLCFIATLGIAPAQAKTHLAIRSAQATVEEEVYRLDTRLELKLPDDARKAIEAGLTLRLAYQIEVTRVRRLLPDATVAALEQRFELSYHALSQRYLVRNLNTGEQQDFGSFPAAIDRLSELRGLPVLDRTLLEEGPRYEGRIRAVLEMNTAPAGLGWLLFWTDNWSATSDWYAWTLRH